MFAPPGIRPGGARLAPVDLAFAGPVIGTLVTVLLAGVPGIYRLWGDLRKARKAAIDEAVAKAVATERLEAVNREAQKALDAKTAETELLREQNERLETALIDCAKGGRG